jgi:hypothetical protein
MKFKILQAGIYNNENHQASEYAKGDELQTGEGYGLSLVASGLAEEIIEDVEVKPDDMPVEKNKKTPSTGKRSHGKSSGNPFVPQA